MSKLNAKEFIEGLEGYNVDCILDDEDLKLAVISIMEEYHQFKLKNNGGLGDVVGRSEQLCPDCGNTGRRLPQTLDSPDGQECECGA